MNIPDLQKAIQEKAEDRLDNDIRNLSDKFRDFLEANTNLTAGVSLTILADDDKKAYPYICQLFESEYVKKRIRERYLERYIQREIDKLIGDKNNNYQNE
jgi:hypothetical protein